MNIKERMGRLGKVIGFLFVRIRFAAAELLANGMLCFWSPVVMFEETASKKLPDAIFIKKTAKLVKTRLTFVNRFTILMDVDEEKR